MVDIVVDLDRLLQSQNLLSPTLLSIISLILLFALIFLDKILDLCSVCISLGYVQ